MVSKKQSKNEQSEITEEEKQILQQLNFWIYYSETYYFQQYMFFTKYIKLL